MTGPEAQRIFNQLPGLNLPFDTFLARLRTSKNYFERFLKNKEDVAYGRPAQPVAGPTDNTKIYYDKDGNPILVPKK